jgi:hypothetical protein
MRLTQIHNEFSAIETAIMNDEAKMFTIVQNVAYKNSEIVLAVEITVAEPERIMKTRNFAL